MPAAIPPGTGGIYDLGGMRQCATCQRWWAAEDVYDFGERAPAIRPDVGPGVDVTPSRGAAYPPICLHCLAERS